MTKKELFQQIGDINEKYVLEAEETRRSIIHNVVFRRSLATAACLVVCVGLGITVLTFGGGSKEAASEAGSSMGTNAVAENSSMKEESTADGSIMDRYASEESYDQVLDAEEEYQESIPEQSIQEPEEGKHEITVNDSVGDGMFEMKYDSIAVKEHLAEYPDDFDKLCETNAFVVMHGEILLGLEKWENFLETVKKGESTSVDIVQFTVEGDAIITNLTYAENSYYVVVDNTRDFWGTGEYIEDKFTYCNVVQREAGVEVLLSKDRLDGDISEENYEDSGVYHLFQYKITE